MSARILIVDDEKLIRWSIKERLASRGHACLEATDGAGARRLARDEVFDLAIVDMKLPDTDGILLLQDLHAAQPGLACIVITAYSTVETAVAAMKRGAVDYLTKPFSIDALQATVDKVLEATEADRAQARLDMAHRRRFGLDSILGDSPAIQRVKDIIGRLAESDAASVLLLGETGTGKDMFARALHYESGRVDRPFMNVTCTALPDSLMDSELFGYEEGAFTDARRQKKGLFEISDGGTLFLDEAGDMPLSLQGKLLRVLEEKAFRRIGGHEDLKVDVRIIAATNRDLAQAMAQGVFRSDLYYRLSTVPIALPPLRERLEDIPALAAHFVANASRSYGRACEGLTPAALESLQRYPWPGNVRELRNTIERAVLLSSGVRIAPDDLALGIRTPSTEGRPVPLDLPHEGIDLAFLEQSLIEQAMIRTGGNQSAAARLLGLTRDQIRYKLDKHGSEDPPA